jgi:hypothetical protein
VAPVLGDVLHRVGILEPASREVEGQPRPEVLHQRHQRSGRTADADEDVVARRVAREQVGDGVAELLVVGLGQDRLDRDRRRRFDDRLGLPDRWCAALGLLPLIVDWLRLALDWLRLALDWLRPVLRPLVVDWLRLALRPLVDWLRLALRPLVVDWLRLARLLPVVDRLDLALLCRLLALLMPQHGHLLRRVDRLRGALGDDLLPVSGASSHADTLRLGPGGKDRPGQGAEQGQGERGVAHGGSR